MTGASKNSYLASMARKQVSAKSEPQLSVRSAKALGLARKIAAAEGRSYPQIVEDALDLYARESERLAGAASAAFWGPIDRIMKEGRARMRAGGTSNLDEFYDDEGLPA